MIDMLMGIWDFVVNAVPGFAAYYHTMAGTETDIGAITNYRTAQIINDLPR